jgi:hypothetical protein
MNKIKFAALIALALSVSACGSMSSLTDGDYSLTDGDYVYSPLVLSGYEKRERGTKYISLEEYKSICTKVTGITKGLTKGWAVAGLGSGNDAFTTLLQGGSVDEVKADWIGPDAFKNDDDDGVIDFKGGCSVTVSVSGIYNGSSSHEEGSTYASDFVVSGSDVLVNFGHISPMGVAG